MLKLNEKVALRLVICATEDDAAILNSEGLRSVRVVRDVNELYRLNGRTHDYELDDTLSMFTEIILALPSGMEAYRDELAVRLGDVRCKWINWPEGVKGCADCGDDLINQINSARPMWTDMVCTMDDIPEPGEFKRYETGIKGLDDHGLRFIRPSFMPVVGPYGSGKSILLRQLACNFWKLHGWRTLLTSFEEQVKPTYERDLRRHLIGRRDGSSEDGTVIAKRWTEEEIEEADAQIRKGFRFLKKNNELLDADLFLDRVEYCIKVYGADVVILDPINELDLLIPKGENKTDYIGRLIIRMKHLANDYNLLFIVAVHPPKEGAVKRPSQNRLMTLNDAADSAHWGNKADVGWCVWRTPNGSSYLHIDKLKNHEWMGKPTLCKLAYDPNINGFSISDIGYENVMRDWGE